MVELYPIIKVSEPSLLNIWKGYRLEGVVVRLQDLLRPRTSKLNSTFYRIKDAGGIHSFLGFPGTIILSLIMKDSHILKFDEEAYSEVINTLKPDFYTTPDGETYEHEISLSIKEIMRCVLQTKKLIKLCPNSKPIGQVKGCNKFLIGAHTNLLKLMGVKDFVFHVGDFFRNGNPHMIAKAKDYSLQVRKNSRRLYLHGMGCQKRLFEFSFADGYITFNHLVKAVNGKKYSGTCEVTYSGGYSTEIVKENLGEMLRNVKNMKLQKKLFEGGVCKWEAAKEEQGQGMPAREAVTKAK